MLTSAAWLAPHVPTLLVDAHRGHHTPMIEALTRASQTLLEEAPAAAVVVSARWASSGPFQVDPGKTHRTLTDYSGFGVEARYDCAGHPALARALIAAGTKARVRVAAATHGVDSGVTVPMHFLVPDRRMPIVPMSVADRPFLECRTWGAAIRRTFEAWPDPVLFVVGGLLSFDPHAWNLGREVAARVSFDERVLEALGAGRWDTLDHERRGLAKGVRTTNSGVEVENELRHLDVLRGFLGADIAGEVHCYEASPGVGAALMAFPVRQEILQPPPTEEASEVHAPDGSAAPDGLAATE